MNARFLRDEAARFRGMAETTDREATRVRFLGMAADYEARAKVADGLTEPYLAEAISDVIEPHQNVETNVLAEQNLGGPMKIGIGRRIATGLKETIVVERRPVVGRRASV